MILKSLLLPVILYLIVGLIVVNLIVKLTENDEENIKITVFQWYTIFLFWPVSLAMFLIEFIRNLF
jgi:hypothetical protein